MRLHDYQEEGLDWLLKRLYIEDAGGAGLLWEMGTGKTAVVLHAIDMLMAVGEVKRTLITGPLRVTKLVWDEEATRWGLNLSFAKAIGPRRDAALAENADIVLANDDVLHRIEESGERFDLIVFDESSRFRNWSTRRTKAARRLASRTPRRLILTGTPTPNHYGDLFAQQFLVDRGATLGTGVTKFRHRFMSRGGFEGRQWFFRDEMVEPFKELVAPFHLRQDALDMPEKIEHDIEVELPPDAMKTYKEVEKEFFTQLDAGLVTAFNAGSAYAKCKQVANGSVYLENGQVGAVHGAKLDALAELVDKPLLVFYQYRHDLSQLLERWPDAHVVGVGPIDFAAPLIFAQPQSCGHGINGFQHDRNDIVWFGPPDQPELYQQANARVHRQGVSGQVRIHRIIARSTVDRAIASRLKHKDAGQRSLLSFMEDYRNGAR